MVGFPYVEGGHKDEPTQPQEDRRGDVNLFLFSSATTGDRPGGLNPIFVFFGSNGFPHVSQFMRTMYITPCTGNIWQSSVGLRLEHLYPNFAMNLFFSFLY